VSWEIARYYEKNGDQALREARKTISLTVELSLIHAVHIAVTVFVTAAAQMLLLITNDLSGGRLWSLVHPEYANTVKDRIPPNVKIRTTCSHD